jgi:gliding motility-associated-like protein
MARTFTLYQFGSRNEVFHRLHSFKKYLGTFLLSTFLMISQQFVFDGHAFAKGIDSENITLSSFARGTGTEADPYQIETWEHLRNIQGQSNKFFILNNDLNSLTSDYETYASATANSGRGWDPIYGNNIEFEGGGFTIADIIINSGYGWGIGIFRDAYISSFKNLFIRDVQILTGGNGEEIGVICGYCWDIIFENVHVINATVDGDFLVGLFAGYGSNFNIINSSVHGVNNGRYYVGGFVGYGWNISINNSYSNVKVENGEYGVGGLIGTGSDIGISNSYAVGAISGTGSDFGGLMGTSWGSVTISNSYWDTETTGQSTSFGGGEGKTTAEMKTQSTFVDWDFTDIWDVNPTGYLSYPFFRNIIYDVPESSSRINPIPGLEASSILTSPTLTTYAASTISAFKATLNGDLTSDGGAPVTEQGFVFSTSNNYPTIGENGVTNVTSGSGTGTFNETVSGLSPSTTYYFQAYATNSQGTSYGGVESFTTSSAGVLLSSSPTLIFTANSADITGDNIASDGEGGSQAISDIDIQIYNISDESGTFVNSLDWRGNDFLFSADPNYSGLTYDNLNQGIKGMSIKSADGSNFRLVQFKYYNWGESSAFTNTIKGYRDGTEVASMTFNGFDADYDPMTITLDASFSNVDEVRLFISSPGWNDDGTTNHSINNIQVTSPIATSAPLVTTSSASNATASTADLAGNITSDGGSEVSARGFVYSSSDNTPTIGEGGVTNVAVGSGTGTFQETVSGLDPSTTYYFQAYATNAEGTSYGGVESFTTIAIPCTGTITIGATASGAAYSINGGVLKTSGNATVPASVIVDYLQNTGDLVIESCDGDIVIDSSVLLTLSNARTLTTKAGGNIIFNSGKKVIATGNKLNFVLWADSDGNNNGMIWLRVGSAINTHNGHLWMGGGNGAVSWNGLPVGDGFAQAKQVITSSEALQVNNRNFSIQNGITLETTSLTTGEGDITIKGKVSNISTEESTGYGQIGVYINRGNTLNTTSGNIHVIGITESSKLSQSWFYGILLASDRESEPNIIQTEAGTITLEGAASQDRNGDFSGGIGIFEWSVSGQGVNEIRTESGDINVFGHNKNITNASLGGITAIGGGLSSKRIYSQSGNIHLIGRSDNPNAIGINLGGDIRVGSDGILPHVGNITLESDIFSSFNSNSRFVSSGFLSVKPITSSTTIGIGGASGTLQLASSIFSTNFENGFKEIIIGSAEAGKITIGGSTTFKDNLTLKSSGQIEMLASSSLTGQVGENASLVLWSDAIANGTGNIKINDRANINTNGGHIWMGSGSAEETWKDLNGPVGAAVSGFAIDVEWASLNSGAGDIRLIGKSTNNFGIRLISNNSLGRNLELNAANVHLLGTSASTATGARGVSLSTSGSGGSALNVSATKSIFIQGELPTANGNPIHIVGDSGGLITLDAQGGNLDLTANKININGTSTLKSEDGKLNIYPIDPNTSIGIGGTAGSLLLSSNNFSTHFADGFSEITIGDNNQIGDISIGAVQFNDPVSLNTSGAISQTGAIDSQGNKINLLRGSVNLSDNDNRIASIRANASNITLTNSTALTLEEISTVGSIKINLPGSNLSITENINSQNTGTDAIWIGAGTEKSAGDPTGGNILITGNPTITVGPGGTAKLFSGSISDSEGLSDLVSIENIRYNSDPSLIEGDPIGDGVYVIFREKDCLNPDNAGEITGTQTICFETAPTIFTNNQSPSGETGTLEFMWQFTTLDPSGLGFDDSNWTDISNSNSASYQSSSLSNTTWFRRLAKVECESDWSKALPSNSIVVNVDEATVSGHITGQNSITYGESTGDLVLSGNLGEVIKWQRRQGDSGTWMDLAITSTVYEESPAETGTWYFRAEVKNGVCNSVFTDAFEVEVSKKELLISGSFTALDKIYDGSEAAVFNTDNLSLSGIVGSDDVSLDNVVLKFNSPNVGENRSVQISSAGLSGTRADNYTLSLTNAPTSTADITPASISVTPDSNQSKIYGSIDPIFTYTFNGQVQNETPSFIGNLGRESGENVNNYNINIGTLALEDNADFLASNYKIEFTDNITFQITAKQLSVIVDTGQSKVYGAADPVFTFKATGFENDDDEDVLSGTLSRAAGENVGNYAINLGSLSAGDNYEIDFNGADFTITKKTLVITADAGQSKVYGAADPVFTFKASGFENNDDEDVLTGSLTRTAGEDVGNYNINLGSLSAGDNYAIDFNGADFTITKKTLVITADAGQSKVYGAADPVFTFKATGFENGDDEDVLSGALARTAGENVGNYAINLGSLSAGDNYAIDFKGPDFAITKKTLVITVDAGQSKVYGAADPDFTFKATGFENDDDEDVLTGTLSRVAGENVGNYAINLGSLSAGDNYEIDFNSADFTITKKTLVITADAGQSKVYGAADPVFTFKATGFENGDDEEVLSGALARAAGENVGNYAINLGSLSAADNYEIDFKGADFAITKATLTVTADAGQSKVYGAADPVFTFKATGFENEDDEDVLTGSLTRTAGEDVGNYNINLGSLSAGDNYAIDFNGADFTITKKTLVITADAGQSKVYGAADPVFTFKANGFENGDDEDMLSGALARTAGENVGNYTINLGSLSAGDNYEIDFNSADFTITKKTLVITADAGQSKVYGAADPVFTFKATGFENGDDEDVLSGALARTAGENVGNYAINLGSLSAGDNYEIDFKEADFTITKKTLVITADAGQSKVYGAADPVFTFKATGFENEDDEDVVTGTLARTAGENVGNYAINLGSLSAGDNYEIDFKGADFAITKATLTVTADAGQSKVYGAADPVFTFKATGFENGDDEEVLSGALARAAGENVGNYAINLGSLSAGDNYEIDFKEADFAITKKTLVITADAGQSKVYGAADPVFTFKATGFENDDDEDVLTGTLARTAGENVGNYAINLGSLSAGDNYEIDFKGADFAITKATLTVTADAGQSKVYGAADPVFTFKATGFENGDDEEVLSGALARAAGENVGNYAINLGSLSAGDNYEIEFNGADFTITKKTLVITADAGQSKVYGAADPVFTFKATGFENEDDEDVLTGTLARTAGENVGNYAINLGSLSAGDNYEIDFKGADFAITKATLTVTADAGQSKVYGAADPVFTFKATGFENGDDEEVLSGALARAAGENVGNYAINLGSLSAGENYVIDFNSADFAITKKTLVITADAGQSKVYGAADPVFTFKATGFENDDDEDVLTGTLARTAGENVGNYAINLGSLSAGDNYEIDFKGADFAITKATLTVTADAGQSKVYGAADPVFTFKATGFENGDDEEVLSGALARAAGENVGNYAINLGSLSAGDNYEIEFNGADFTITKKTLVITADAGQSKVYGAADPVFTFKATGFENDDDEDVLTGTLARTAGENVGNYAINLGSLSAGDNYAIDFNSADFTITKKTLVITADAGQSKVYGTADPVFTFKATGFENDDDMLSGALARAKGENVGSYAINLGSLSAGDNYEIDFNGADFTITKKTLVITAENKSKIYGEENPTLTFTYSGLVNNDQKIDNEPVISTTANQSSNAGTYPILLEGGSDENYNITLENGTLTVGKKALTITADDKVKVYGDENPILTFTYTGLVNGDTQISTEPKISTSANLYSNIGTYPIELIGAEDGNYTITMESGQLEVSPAILELTVDHGQFKIYGTEDPVFKFTAVGFKLEDNEDLLRGTLERTEGENVGNYPIQLGSIYAGDNYTITFTGNEFSIIPARLEAVISPADVETEWNSSPELPQTITIMTEDGRFLEFEVTWDLANLNLLSRGEYEISGSIKLPEGVLNEEGLKGILKVRVLAKPAPEDLLLSNNTFEGSATEFFIHVGGFSVVDPIDETHVIALAGDAGDNRYFEIIDKMLFWSSAEQVEGRNEFTVHIQVSDRDGNILTKTFEIRRVRKSVSDITVFNSFTPNGDGVNDTWGIPDLRFYQGVTIRVFERSGLQVFVTNNPDHRWNGTHNGKELPVGSYYWVLEVQETGESRRGILNLIRK